MVGRTWKQPTQWDNGVYTLLYCTITRCTFSCSTNTISRPPHCFSCLKMLAYTTKCSTLCYLLSNQGHRRELYLSSWSGSQTSYQEQNKNKQAEICKNIRAIKHAGENGLLFSYYIPKRCRIRLLVCFREIMANQFLCHKLTGAWLAE